MVHRVLIVEDHPLVREGYAVLFEHARGLDLCAALPSAEAAIAWLADGACDLVVTDVRLPGMSGLDLLDYVHEQFPVLPVLVVTAHLDDTVAQRAEAGGAAGTLAKERAGNELLPTVRRLLDVRA